MHNEYMQKLSYCYLWVQKNLMILQLTKYISFTTNESMQYTDIKFVTNIKNFYDRNSAESRTILNF